MSSPEPASPIQRYLEELHRRHGGLREGEVATYIPELAKADPDAFGICVATTDGHVYEVGDSREPFTILRGRRVEAQRHSLNIEREPRCDCFHQLIYPGPVERRHEHGLRIRVAQTPEFVW